MQWIAMVLVALAGATEPYVPTDDGEVLESLPRAVLAGRDALAERRRALLTDPDNASLAAEVAGSYLDLGKASGDPRYFGYAQAAIGRWWTQEAPPTGVLRMRAALREMNHDYDGALADLERLVEREPEDRDGWSAIANLHRVRGDYAAAWAASDRLAVFDEAVPVMLTRAPLLLATGRLDEAAAEVEAVLPDVAARWASAVPRALLLRGEAAWARGDRAAAESHFRAALNASPGDGHTLRAYGDLLLDQGRNADALALLTDHTRDTGVHLRAAIAARRIGDVRWTTWRDDLSRRFAEIRLRGGEPHGRYEARHALELLDDPERALTLALASWRQQKELRDARTVLEAAVAARDPDAARPVLGFLKGHGTRHAALDEMVARLEAE